MTFAQPQWFWALALLPLLAAIFIANESRRAKLLRLLVAARLQDRLAGTVSIGKRRLRFALLLAGAALVIASLAQPQLGYTWEQSQRKGRDVLLAIDVSKSMLANDLAPSRLARAKLAAQDLIAQLGGDRVGLVAFAGSAFLQAPLTVDYSAVLNSLKELDSEIIPRGGSNLAETIKVAVEAFGKGESENRALIIFSDGEELDADGVAAAAKLAGQVRIFTVGIGTADGALIPLPGGGTEFVKDESGQFVKSRLDESRLRKIAESTGGFYVHLLSGPAEMTQIVREGLGKMTEKDIDAKMSRQPIERYQWPLAAGLVLLAASMLVSERRRIARAAAALFAALAFAPAPAQSAPESPKQLYSAGRYDDAQAAYEKQAEKDPDSAPLAFNWGAAAYKNHDYDTALSAFSHALTSDDAKLRAKAEYNLANTLLQKGAPKLEEKPLRDALAHYEQALKLQPKDADAQHNKKFTEELLAKLEEQKQQQKQDQKKDKKDDQKKDQKDQEKQQQGDKKDEKQQQSGDQSKQDKEQQGEKSEQQKQDGQKSKDQQEKDGEKQPQDGGKKDEQKDGEKQDAQSQQAKNDAQQNKDGAKPEPMPDQADKKPAGELKASPSEPQQPQDAQSEAAADEAAAVEGRMTERQAKALLDSLKSEDDRVRLIDPNERKRAGRVLRDW